MNRATTTFTCPHCGERTRIRCWEKTEQAFDVILRDGKVSHELVLGLELDDAEYVCLACDEQIATDADELSDIIQRPVSASDSFVTG